MAEGVGFEPTVGFPTPVFKTGTFGRSVTLPYIHLAATFTTLLRNGHLVTPATRRTITASFHMAIVTSSNRHHD